MTNGQAIEIMEFRRDMAAVGSDLRIAINKAINALRDMETIRGKMLDMYRDCDGEFADVVDGISCANCAKHGNCHGECTQSDDEAIGIFMDYLTGKLDRRRHDRKRGGDI